jgi:hypothetical protein
MGEHIRLQFRPSLIIFVGETGRQIHDQFLGPRRLLVHLDQTLRQSVGLLLAQTPDEDQYIADMIEPLPSEIVFPDDPDMPKESGSIEDVTYRSLVSVQLDRRRLEIGSAGYAVPNPRTQIFIVGDLERDNALRMAEILRVVREIVRQNHFDTPVCYFLNCYRSQPTDYSSNLIKSLDDPSIPLKWFDYEIANTSFLYEHMITHPFPTFMTESEVRYATAEAILALAATGISSSAIYESEMLLPAQLENYGQRVGSMSTSMIRFPRMEAQNYCSALLSSKLVQKWQEDIDRSRLSDEGRKALILKARETAHGIRMWVQDSVPRPLAEESLYPSLDILRYKQPQVSDGMYTRQVEIHRRRMEQTRDLFDLFYYDTVDKQYKGQRQKTDSWFDIAYKRFGRGIDRYARWEVEIRKAWEAASNKSGEDIKYQVDKLWTSSDDGLELARIFVRSLDDALTQLADQASQWRQEHEAAYKGERSRFEQLAIERDEWKIDDDEPNIVGAGLGQAGQARPTMGGQGPVIGSSLNTMLGGSTSAIINAPPPIAGPQHVPAHEEKIALNLGRRAQWKQDQVPGVLILFAISLLGWLVVTLTLALFTMVPILLYALNGIMAALTIVGGLALRYQRQRQAEAAREDVLAFYRSYYVYKCGYAENLQRIGLIKTLRSRVTRMRERLEDMSAFLSLVDSQAQKDTKEVSDQLFNGPAGIRDIFIANGERLQRHGKHTLDDVDAQVTQLRINHPLQEWHRTLEDMKDELIKSFRAAPVSLIEMTQQNARDYINNFTTKIVSGYLTGSLVSISAALDKPEIWREVLDRVRKPLYFAGVGIREPRLLFICGSTKDLGRSIQYIPSEAITVETKSAEWLMVVAFFRGGEPTVLNPDTLFLPKTVPPPAGGPPGGAGSSPAQASPGMPHSLVQAGVAQVATGKNYQGPSSAYSLDDDDDDATNPRRRPHA